VVTGIFSDGVSLLFVEVLPLAFNRRSPEELYLELLKKCLLDMIYADQRESADLQYGLPFDRKRRRDGKDWPAYAHTMIGMHRLDNIQFCIEDVLRKDIPGDLIEAGVWRGGATIFMRGVLAAHGVTDRRVWVADSFRGLPPPNPDRFPADADDTLHTFSQLAVSAEEVRGNFEKYGLLDPQVCFLEGWFQETLPSAPIEKLAVVRLDGDMYESTWVGLTHLYPKLSRGGYIIIDDYGAIEACRQAVEDFRRVNRISAKIEEIDWTGICWKKP